MHGLDFDEIKPDVAGNWLNQSNSNFAQLIPLADRQTKLAKNADDERTVFKLSAPGVNTARDEWVYDFSFLNLRDKVLFFADTYNELIDYNDESFPTTLKWSEGLRSKFWDKRQVVYNEANRIQSLYRPFVAKNYYSEVIMSDRLTSNHHEMFGNALLKSNSGQNLIICFLGPGGRPDFSILATDKVPSYALFIDVTQCLPLYRYTGDGERVSNITQWGIDRINGHYRQEWGDDFQTLAGEDGITAEEIFAYTYAVLHDPVYRHDYRVDLLREFPRLPLYRDFHHWSEKGQKLLDLHIGFESAEPYPLDQHDREGVDPKRAILRADKERGTITLDERTTLAGVPEKAWEYQLGSRSALEWVLDQYKERKPRDPTIREKFNTYRFSDHKERVIDLLRRVCTVSVATMEIVDSMAHRELEERRGQAPGHGV